MVFLAACSASVASPAPAEPEGVPVREVSVDRAPVTRVIRSAGLLATKDEMSLSFKIGGVLQSVLVNAGSRVSKGQVLARLDPTEVQAGVTQAREAFAKASRDYDRLKGLVDKGEIPIADFQNVTTAKLLAEAQLQAALFNEKHSVITAPTDGWIDRKKGEPGEVVGPGQPIFHLNGKSRGFVVRVALSDKDTLALSLGDVARVRLDARPEAVFAGRVSEIARSASPLTGTFEVEVQLDVVDASLLSGLTAKVEIDQKNAATARIPLAALVQSRGSDARVFIRDPRTDRVLERAVKLAFTSGDQAAVLTGLDGVERVITEGAQTLAAGTLVRIVK
jgi:RND family efflux transporter MFP subunit